MADLEEIDEGFSAGDEIPNNFPVSTEAKIHWVNQLSRKESLRPICSLIAVHQLGRGTYLRYHYPCL